jgi:radical SAM protein with 4Fe4S-binding SPASM domain
MAEDNNFQLSGHKMHHHIDELVKWKKGENFPPLYVEIGPISACNHRCKHCYVDYLGHQPKRLSNEVLNNLMQDMGEFGVKSACFAGRGEPLMHTGLGEACVIGKDAGLDLALATNGVFFDSRKADVILPTMEWVRISILGGAEETYMENQKARPGDWKKLIKNLSYLAKLKKRQNLKSTVGVVFFVFENNGHEVLPTARLMKETGIDYVVFKGVGDYQKNNNYVSDKGLSEKFDAGLIEAENLSTDSFSCVVRRDMMDETYGGKPYDKCLSLPFMTNIDSDGRIFGCGGYWQDDRYCYGDINKQSFSEIWNGEEHKKIMNNMINNVNFEECYNCCRNHAINKFLDSLDNPPNHINFI